MYSELSLSIDNVAEEQVFEKTDLGFKFIIPPSSLDEGQKSANTSIKMVKRNQQIPPDSESVSCFFEITSTGFKNPVQFHLKHNVDLRFCDKKNLAFVTLKDSQFVYCENYSFDTENNFGVIEIDHFSSHVFGIVWKIFDAIKPVRLYVMTPLYKRIDQGCWQFKMVITQDLEPFFEVLVLCYNLISLFDIENESFV